MNRVACVRLLLQDTRRLRSAFKVTCGLGDGNESSRVKLREKRPSRGLDGGAEDVGSPSIGLLAIGANAKKASLLTPWDLFNGSDARRAVEFASAAYRTGLNPPAAKTDRRRYCHVLS